MNLSRDQKVILGIVVTVILIAVILYLWNKYKARAEAPPTIPGVTPSDHVPPDLVEPESQDYIECFSIDENGHIPYRFYHQGRYQIDEGHIILSFESPEEKFQILLNSGLINETQYQRGVEQARSIMEGELDLRLIGTKDEMQVYWCGSDICFQYRSASGTLGGARHFAPFVSELSGDKILTYIEVLLERGIINNTQYQNGILQINALGYK